MNALLRVLCRLVLLALLGGTLTTPAAALVARVVLDNGLSVVACPHEASDVAAVFVGFRVGAGLDNPPGIRALVHEHSRARVERLLRSDETFAPLKVAISQGSSVTWRAEWDYLAMRANCTSAQLPLLLKLIQQGIFSTEIEPEFLEEGREHLRAEYETMPRRHAEQTYYLLREAMLGEVPAARPVFATPESTAAITTEQAGAFVQQYCQAANAVVAVVAPLPVDEVVSLVRDCLGSVPAGTLAETDDAVILPGSRARVVGNQLTNLATIIVGVPLPPPGDRGFLVGQVLYHILHGGQGRLARDRALVRSLALNMPFRLLAERTPVSVLPVARSRHPHLAIYAECDPHAVENVHRTLLSHIESLGEGAIRPEELGRAKENLINADARIMLGPTMLATRLGRRAMLGGDLDSPDAFASQVQAISTEDIVGVAEMYFRSHYIGVQMPDHTAAHERGPADVHPE